MNQTKLGLERLFQRLKQFCREEQNRRYESPTGRIIQQLNEEMDQNYELNINPRPLPGRKNGLTQKNAFPVSSLREEHKLVKWLSGHADKMEGFEGTPAMYKIMQQMLCKSGFDRAYDKLTVVYYNDMGFLVGRTTYYFDVSSFYCA